MAHIHSASNGEDKGATDSARAALGTSRLEPDNNVTLGNDKDNFGWILIFSAVYILFLAAFVGFVLSYTAMSREEKKLYFGPTLSALFDDVVFRISEVLTALNSAMKKVQ